MEYKDYYKILEVDKNVSGDDIKKSYRKLARKYHPDVNSGDKTAEEKFKSINEAYEVLGNPEKRKKYDRLGASWNAYQSGGSRGSGGFDWGQWVQHTNVDLHDIFGAGAGGATTDSGSGFSDFFETIFGSTSKRSTRAGGGRMRRQGQDYTHEIEITLEEAYTGTARTLKTSNNRRLEVKIPRGSKTGTKIRVKGQGGQGSGGAVDGDLYLKVNVVEHPHFVVDGEDLKTEVSVDLYTALLGGEAEVKTLKGVLKLKIPAETQNGKIFRLKNQGMPKLNKPDVFGNLYVNINVKLPQNLTKDEKALFKELRDMQL